MAVYDCRNEDIGRVFDANKVEIPGMIIRCDTKTGEVLRYVQGQGGVPVLQETWIEDMNTGYRSPGPKLPLHETVMYDAPLVFERGFYAERKIGEVVHRAWVPIGPK